MIAGLIKSKGFRWAKLLFEKGIYKFKFKELPESLKDKAALKNASANRIIIECGKANDGVKEWELSSSVRIFKGETVKKLA